MLIPIYTLNFIIGINSNDASYDPRTDIRLNRSDYQRTPMRERFPKK